MIALQPIENGRKSTVESRKSRDSDVWQQLYTFDFILSTDKKASMAELVDALDSKSGYRKVVQVRFLFGAHLKTQARRLRFFWSK